VKPNPVRTITEKQFQALVIQLAKLNGWMVFHPMPVQNSKGVWRTAVAGDAGFPDLVLAHATKGLIIAELKSRLGRTTKGQDEWLDTLRLAGAETYVWRFSDLRAIKARLAG